MPNIGGALKQAAVDVNEAAVKPVVDEVGKAIEEGVQSTVTGPKPLDPAMQQQKRVDEQKRKDWAVHVINWNKQIQQEQQKVRGSKQQEQMQKSQEESEKQKVKQFKLVEKQQKQQVQMNTAQLAARKAEIKRGVGG